MPYSGKLPGETACTPSYEGRVVVDFADGVFPGLQEFGPFGASIVPEDDIFGMTTIRQKKGCIFLDFTGTLSDDEPLIRNAIQNIVTDIVRANAENTDNQAVLAQLLDTSEQGKSPKEIANMIMNSADHLEVGSTTIDWQEFWRPLEGRNYGAGAGNMANFKYFQELGLIPQDFHFQLFEVLVMNKYYSFIEQNALKMRPEMDMVLADAKARSVPVAIITKDSRELAQLKLRALGLTDENDQFVPDCPILFYVSQDDCPASADGSKRPLYVLGVKEFEKRFPDYDLDILLVEDTMKALEGAAEAAEDIREMGYKGHRMDIRVHYAFDISEPFNRFATHRVDVLKLRLARLVAEAITLMQTQQDPGMFSFLQKGPKAWEIDTAAEKRLPPGPFDRMKGPR